MTEVELSEIVRNYAIVIGGAVGLLLAIWRGLAADRQSRAAREQAAIDRRGHITGVFKDAVGQLSDDRLEIRLGAIYALKQISRDFPDFAETVLGLLLVYARERSKGLEGDEAPVDLKEVISLVPEEMARDGS